MKELPNVCSSSTACLRPQASSVYIRNLSFFLLVFTSLTHGLALAGLEKTERERAISIPSEKPKLHTLKEFAPPGNLQDLNVAGRKNWSEAHISKWMDVAIKDFKNPNLTQFFNGRHTPYDTKQPGVIISWIGFPHVVETNPHYPTVESQLKAAEATRNKQDEYLEWSTLKQGKDIHRVVFTCEGPEYWEYYFQHQRDDAIKTMREMNAPYLDHVPKKAFFKVDPSDPDNEDLWKYNERNPYNNSTRTGVLTHLIQGANTLHAEIYLASGASVIRKDKEHNPITDEQELIHCAKYGVARRNSDPRIGSAVNSLARSGHSISIADPVALYMHNLDLGGLKLDPTGDQTHLIDIPRGTFNFTRGDYTKGLALRLHVEIPKGVKSLGGKQLYVSDIYDTRASEYIEYGGQLAKRITMSIRGVAIAGIKPAPARKCIHYHKNPMNEDRNKERIVERYFQD